jgi:hypothetical protein
MFLAPGMFVLFMAAYPCVMRPEDFDKCPFSVPSVSAWRAVAEAVTNPNLPIQKSSAIFACIAGAVSILQAVVRHWYLVGPREKYRAYLPSWMAIAISFVVPQTYYSTAALIGAYITFFWKKKNAQSYEVYGYAVAAGMSSSVIMFYGLVLMSKQVSSPEKVLEVSSARVSSLVVSVVALMALTLDVLWTPAKLSDQTCSWREARYIFVR